MTDRPRPVPSPYPPMAPPHDPRHGIQPQPAQRSNPAVPAPPPAPPLAPPLAPPRRPDATFQEPSHAPPGAPLFGPARPGSPRGRSERTRRWPWIAGIVVAFLVGLAVPTGGGVVPVDASGPDPLAGGVLSPTHPGPFRLEAASTLGREIQVTYDNGRGGVDQSPRDTAGTFAVTVPEQGAGGAFLSVSSSPSIEEYSGDPRSDTVTCRITDAKGAVVDEQSGTGQNANASCAAY